VNRRQRRDGTHALGPLERTAGKRVGVKPCGRIAEVPERDAGVCLLGG
jgi:hypothetical protein